MPEGLLIFALVFAASVAAPGPDTMTIFSRALAGGRFSALPFTLGVVLAKVTLLTLVVLGLAAVAEAFGPLFVVFKFAGAAYLVWIGVRLWFKDDAPDARALSTRVSWRDALTGFALGVSNPHAIVFYVALLPTVVEVQHLDLTTHLLLTFIIVLLTLVVAGIYALSADRLRSLLQSPKARRVTNRVAGGVMVGSGIVVATR